MKKVKKWTLEKVDVALNKNKGDYGSMITIAALYRKLYGKYPKIGLSGGQAEYADEIWAKLP